MIDARDVTAVVVTYNRLPLLRRCLAALQAQTAQGLRVLVVDNASADGTAEYLKKRSPCRVLSAVSSQKISAVQVALPLRHAGCGGTGLQGSLAYGR